MIRFADLTELERECNIEENDEPIAQRQADGTIVGLFLKAGVRFVYDPSDENGEAVMLVEV